MCLSRLIAVFGSLMSTHIRISPGLLGFGTITNYETQGVGPSGFSNMSASSRFSILLPTASLAYRGIRL